MRDAMVKSLLLYEVEEKGATSLLGKQGLQPEQCDDQATRATR